MARGGGGGGRSGVSRSSSRSGGGHRSSSSGRSRSTSRSYSGGGSSFRSSTRHHYGSRTVHHHYHDGSSSSGLGGVIFAVLFTFILIAIVTHNNGSFSSSVKSSYAREKLDLGYNYDYNCVEDNAYWLNSPTQVAKGLKYFYDKTGVQPYILIESYKPELTTDSQKFDYAVEFYENNFPNENVFLYVYFEDYNDTGEGYQCYVNGLKIDAMMDNEACDIFWNYIDAYWYSDMSSDDLYVKVFEKTADTITTKSKTGFDVAWIAGLLLIVIAIPVGVVVVISKKRKAEAEKAAETERILNTPMQDLQKGSDTDDLVNKYK